MGRYVPQNISPMLLWQLHWRMSLWKVSRRTFGLQRARLESIAMIPEIAGGVALAGLATWAGFESMWPTLHAYGRSFIGLEPGGRTLALTYDDGPNDPHTLRLIEVLARH